MIFIEQVTAGHFENNKVKYDFEDDSKTELIALSNTSEGQLPEEDQDESIISMQTDCYHTHTINDGKCQRKASVWNSTGFNSSHKIV